MTAALEVVTDAKRWNELMQARFSSMQDVYYGTELFEVYARQYGARPEAIAYEDDAVTVFYPYLVRNIKKIPLFTQLPGELFDITTPYGYGGPLIEVKKQEHAAQGIADFRSKFEQYAREQHYVTEFVRFHPILENHRFFESDLEVVKLSPIAITDLTLSPKELLKRFGADKRRGIQKAEKAGVQVEFIHAPAKMYLEEFLEIYRETMDKNTAEEKYYFTAEQLQELCAALGQKVFLARAVLGEMCIASYLVFQSGGYLTNYLSGNLQVYRQYYPKNKVIWELVKYGHAHGCRFYNLGGGRESLLSFKAGFSTELKPFYVGKKVFDEEIYQTLVSLADLADAEKSFFPAYRHHRLYHALV